MHVSHYGVAKPTLPKAKVGVQYTISVLLIVVYRGEAMEPNAAALVVLVASEMGDCVDDDSTMLEVIETHPQDYIEQRENNS